MTVREEFETWAATFCLRNNSRTINCTPRAAELIAKLQAAYEAGRVEGMEEAAKIADFEAKIHADQVHDDEEFAASHGLLSYTIGKLAAKIRARMEVLKGKP